MDDFDWDLFLALLGERRVVPVVGRELVVIERGGRRMLLDDAIAEELATDLGMEMTEPLRRLELSGLVSLALSEKRITQAKVYPKLKLILDRLHPEVPEPLRKLAEIADFRTLIATTFDPLLELALARRPEGVKALSFSLHSAIADIPAPAGREGQTFLYQIFGRASTFVDDYAVTEENLLEFLHHLPLETHKPKNLFHLLQQSDLLFLGCGYSNWLARFFIRILKNARFGPSNRFDFIADRVIRDDQPLVLFLRLYEAQLFGHGGAVDFVDELHRRWMARRPADRPEPAAAPPPQAMLAGTPRRPVFISYAREDKVAVRAFAQALEQARIDFWLDEKELGAGEEWAREIRLNVQRCSCFVPFISNNTETSPTAYFRKEWKYALERLDENTGSGLPFLFPVALEAIDPQRAHVPDEFRGAQWEVLPAGNPTKDFMTRLRDAYRLWQAPQYQPGEPHDA